MKSLPYKVWMGYRNYRGELVEHSVVAAFCSKERALAYIDLSLWWERDPDSRLKDVYGLMVGDKMYQITPLEEGINEEERSAIE